MFYAVLRPVLHVSQNKGRPKAPGEISQSMEGLGLL